MVHFLLTSFLSRLISQRPLLMYAVSWTGLLTLTVAVASFSPEVAFVKVITPSSPFAKECRQEGHVRVLADVPMEILCLPDVLFRKSRIDFLVPPMFAALVVGGSACVVGALGLWEELWFPATGNAANICSLIPAHKFILSLQSG